MKEVGLDLVETLDTPFVFLVVLELPSVVGFIASGILLRFGLQSSEILISAFGGSTVLAPQLLRFRRS
jgi:hypothetical protein